MKQEKATKKLFTLVMIVSLEGNNKNTNNPQKTIRLIELSTWASHNYGGAEE